MWNGTVCTMHSIYVYFVYTSDLKYQNISPTIRTKLLYDNIWREYSQFTFATFRTQNFNWNILRRTALIRKIERQRERANAADTRRISISHILFCMLNNYEFALIPILLLPVKLDIRVLRVQWAHIVTVEPHHQFLLCMWASVINILAHSSQTIFHSRSSSAAFWRKMH